MEKFEVGEVVLYQNGNCFELGIVKRVCDNGDCFVWYHTGDTAARTPSCYLHKLTNSYAFSITRLSCDSISKESYMEKALAILKAKEIDISDMMLEEIDDSEEGMTSEDWRESYNSNLIPKLQLTFEEWNLLVYVFKKLI